MPACGFSEVLQLNSDRHACEMTRNDSTVLNAMSKSVTDVDWGDVIRAHGHRK